MKLKNLTSSLVRLGQQIRLSQGKTTERNLTMRYAIHNQERQRKLHIYQ